METKTMNRVVYEAVPNDANDKRAHGSWKVCVREFDADGLMIRSQKYAQEIYREDHARKIASALNGDAAAPELLTVAVDSLAVARNLRQGCDEMGKISTAQWEAKEAIHKLASDFTRRAEAAIAKAKGK